MQMRIYLKYSITNQDQISIVCQNIYMHTYGNMQKRQNKLNYQFLDKYQFLQFYNLAILKQDIFQSSREQILYLKLIIQILQNKSIQSSQNMSSIAVIKQNELYTETKLNIEMNKGDKWVKKGFQYSTCSWRYLYSKDGKCCIKHILANGTILNQEQKTDQFCYKIIDESNIILYSKPLHRHFQIQIWNLKSYKKSTLKHKKPMNQLFNKLYVFSQSKLVCIQDDLRGLEGGKNYQYKVLTYYQYPFEQNAKPLNTYMFEVKKISNISVFQIDNSSKLVYVELIVGKDKSVSDAPIVVDIKYRFCDQNGYMIRKCPHVQATKKQIYVPQKIVQANYELQKFVHIRFVIKSKKFKQTNRDVLAQSDPSSKYQSDVFYLRQKFGNQPFYQVLWSYQSGNLKPCFNMFPLNTGNNIQFLNLIRRQQGSTTYKSKPMKIDFYEPKNLTKLGEQIQNDEYNNFQISHFDPKVYIDYSYETNKIRNKIIVNIKITKMKQYFAPLNKMSFMMGHDEQIKNDSYGMSIIRHTD